MNQLKIEYIDPNQLTPYDKNTRKHTQQDVEAIKKSILEDGFNDPIGIWGEQNIIVEGHGRQIAALELNLDKVPVIRLDHLSDKQRREYAIRHNRTAELSGWDFDTLAEECATLAIEGQDFPELKFTWNNDDALGVSDDKEVPLKEKYQLIVDCDSEDDMQEKYEILQEAGVECRVSTL